MTDARPGAVPPRWLLITLAIAAAAALAFAIGRFTAFSTAAAPATPATDSADAGFARDMQVHHSQAVEMAMIIYAKTEDELVRTLAYDMATAQSAQSGEMYGWLVEWGLPQSGGQLMGWMTDAAGGHEGHSGPSSSSTEAQLRAAMGMATDAELAELRAATGTEADCLFLGLMIRHHEGAIDMVDAVQERGEQPRVLAVAKSMAGVQQSEIDAMRGAQVRLGC
ncbi:MAG TPA: DUF305 domain-containing protein [Microbacterium sp.]|uniref:DUF305 domain-containing protein n=1 Tax=Microbacterium sp. TaxID=51671 RepID=UPI002C05C97F|nr:DUF305 domain-containing protein [Microbacterium sp.]HWI31575.1 DUF305 domain-containing protein [Microbacterium sp.]